MADRPYKFNVKAGNIPNVSNSVYRNYPEKIANNMKFTREDIK